MASTEGRYVNVAVLGCCHGELDRVYDKIKETARLSGRSLDLLIVCGDFETVRDPYDLMYMAVPPKYRHMNTFHQYLSGEKVAPVLTLFIGGNHEASNVLQSLYYGGYVAPRIYFMGFGGVVWYKGLRIAGLSGIYKDNHYHYGTVGPPAPTKADLSPITIIVSLIMTRCVDLLKDITSALHILNRPCAVSTTPERSKYIACSI